MVEASSHLSNSRSFNGSKSTVARFVSRPTNRDNRMRLFFFCFVFSLFSVLCVLFLEWRIQLSSMFTLAHPFQDSQNLFWNADAQANHSSGQRIPPHRLLQYAVSHTHDAVALDRLLLYLLFISFLAPSFEFPSIFLLLFVFFSVHVGFARRRRRWHHRMGVLASREHTCIHPEVSRSANKNEGCKTLNDRRLARQDTQQKVTNTVH